MHNISEAHLELVSVKTFADDRDELKTLLKKNLEVQNEDDVK